MPPRARVRVRELALQLPVAVALALLGLEICAAASASTPAAGGPLRLPSFLSDHMVLQRGGGVVWGWAAPGELVQATVKAADGRLLASGKATAGGADGAWEVALTVGAQLTSVVEVRAAGGASVLLQDVAWGDVFLCSGQVRAPPPPPPPRSLPHSPRARDSDPASRVA